MISLNRLLFPQFIFQEEVTLRDSKIPLYKLNWDEIDKIRRERYIKDIPDDVINAPVDNLYPFTTLPAPYNKWVKDMLFVIPSKYMEEIRRNARIGIIEWSQVRPFDTMIREICLEPAKQYIYVAFRLIVDCMYNKDTQYYYRGPDKAYATQALLYKFWSLQTGSGLIKDNAQFRRIEGYKNEKGDWWAPRPEIEKFIEVIKGHEQKLFKAKEKTEEKDAISDFFNSDHGIKILQIPEKVVTISIPIGDGKNFVTVKLRKIVLYNNTTPYPYFAQRYEMKAETNMDDPKVLKQSHQTFDMVLHKSKAIFKIKGIRVRGFSYSDVMKCASCDDPTDVVIRMSITTLETIGDSEKYKSSVVKNIDLERADDLVMEELGNKVIKKNGKIKLRSVMDDILEIQESTPVKEVNQTKIVAEPEGEYPEGLNDRFEYSMLQGPPPKDPFDFDIDPKNVKPWPVKEFERPKPPPTKASSDGQPVAHGA